MYLTYQQHVEGSKHLMRTVPILAVAPAFGELLNTLGKLWEVDEGLTLGVRHLETPYGSHGRTGDPYSVFYLYDDEKTPNAHPQGLDLPWVKMMPNKEDKSPTAVHIEYYVGSDKKRDDYCDFHSIYQKALAVAHFLFEGKTAVNPNEYQEFSLLP